MCFKIKLLLMTRMIRSSDSMVGPDGVVSSGAAGAAVDDELQRQRWNDDDDDVDEDDEADCDETDGTAADMTADADVDVVQLLTRRLSVTPPTDVHHSCPDVGLQERQQMTTGSSTEVDTNQSLFHLLSQPCVAKTLDFRGKVFFRFLRWFLSFSVQRMPDTKCRTQEEQNILHHFPCHIIKLTNRY